MEKNIDLSNDQAVLIGPPVSTYVYLTINTLILRNITSTYISRPFKISRLNKRIKYVHFIQARSRDVRISYHSKNWALAEDARLVANS